MRSNSESDTRSVLVGAECARRAIQHCVDVLETVGGGEALGQCHRLVDRNPIRHLRAMAQLEYPDQQNGMLDGIEERGTAIGPRGEVGIERLASAPDTLDQLAEVLAIRTRHVLGVVELLNQVL